MFDKKGFKDTATHPPSGNINIVITSKDLN